MSGAAGRCTARFLILAAISCGAGAAEAAEATVELDAPAPLDAFLRQHLELPETLPDATTRATLMRRARGEIAELLATEGYFSPRIDLFPEAADSLRIVVVPDRKSVV